MKELYGHAKKTTNCNIVVEDCAQTVYDVIYTYI